MQRSYLQGLWVALQFPRLRSSSSGILTLAAGCNRQRKVLQQGKHLHYGLKRQRRRFHASPRWRAVKPFILADIGEGMFLLSLLGRIT